jgi:mono/diheme cytochrome c family protein
MGSSIPAYRRLVYWVQLLAVTVTIVGLPRASGAQSRPLGAALPAQISAGEETFTAQCAACHGAGGAGGTCRDLRRVRLHHAKDDQD